MLTCDVEILGSESVGGFSTDSGGELTGVIEVAKVSDLRALEHASFESLQSSIFLTVIFFLRLLFFLRGLTFLLCSFKTGMDSELSKELL